MSDRKSKAQNPKSKELEQLQLQIEQLTEALQRERADVINVRRRHDEQVANLKTLVKANVVRDLLPVIDNFERALKHVPPRHSGLDPESSQKGRSYDSAQDDKMQDWIKGVMSIKAQFEQTLDQMGVSRIKTVGEVFDPRVHEAVSMEDAGGTVEVVCEELQPGYAVGNDVIRHAMVKVKMENEEK